MIQKLLSLAMLGTLTLLACKKDDTTNPNNNVPCDVPNRLSKMVFYHYQNNGSKDSTQYLMVYNAAGQLTKRQLKTDYTASYTDYDYFEYDAEGNCTKHDWKTFTGSPSQYFEYDYIDQKRMVTRYYSSISPGAPIDLRQTTNFFYTDNQLVKIENDQPQFGNPPTIGTFSYSNGGKRVQYDFDDHSGNIQTTIFYYTDLNNPIALPELRFGHPDTHFLKDSIVDPMFPQVLNDFKYTVDNSGRVLTKTVFVYAINEYAVIERYYYDCQE